MSAWKECDIKKSLGNLITELFLMSNVTLTYQRWNDKATLIASCLFLSHFLNTVCLERVAV